MEVALNGEPDVLQASFVTKDAREPRNRSDEQAAPLLKTPICSLWPHHTPLQEMQLVQDLWLLGV